MLYQFGSNCEANIPYKNCISLHCFRLCTIQKYLRFTAFLSDYHLFSTLIVIRFSDTEINVPMRT